MASNLVTNLQQNPSPFESVTKVGAYEPFNLQVARTQIAGHSPFLIYGYSNQVGNTAFGPLWEGLTQSGGLYPFPASAAQLTITSSSASDTSALKVLIQGLDANFAPISEVIALNGTSNVTSVNSYLRINNVSVTNGTNVGNISFKQSTTLLAQINAGLGVNQASIYTVPAGYTLYILRSYKTANIGFTSGAWINFEVQFNDNVTGAQKIVQEQTFVQQIEINYEQMPRKVTEKTDIQYLYKTSTGGPLICSQNLIGILIKNDGQTA
jgi:hypothetical protein